MANSAIFPRILVYFYIYILYQKKWSLWRDGDGGGSVCIEFLIWVWRAPEPERSFYWKQLRDGWKQTIVLVTCASHWSDLYVLIKERAKSFLYDTYNCFKLQLFVCFYFQRTKVGDVITVGKLKGFVEQDRRPADTGLRGHAHRSPQGLRLPSRHLTLCAVCFLVLLDTNASVDPQPLGCF